MNAPSYALKLPETVAVQTTGDELERTVRFYNQNNYVIQNIEADGSETLHLIFKKVDLFENYR